MWDLVRDLRFSVRTLIRKPVFVTVILLSLAFGIGGNTAIYTLLDAVFFRPFEAEKPEELAAMHITMRNANGQYEGQFGYSNSLYRSLVETNSAFTGLALYQWAGMNFTGGAEPERGTGMFVSANYFDVLGLSPSKGRFFTPDEDATPGTHLVTILTHSYWQRRFGADPGILGREITVNGHQLTVVGVGPPRFAGTLLEATTDLWVPSMLYPVLSPYGEYFQSTQASLFRAFGRLRPGLSLEQAQRDLTAGMPGAAEGLITEAKDLGARLVPLFAATIQQPGMRNRYAGYGSVLMATVLLVLFIACLNVANLLLAHGRERVRELALRRAVGAGRGRLIRQLLTETLVLFLGGGLLSIPVALWTLGFLWSLRPSHFSEDALEVGLNPGMLLVSLGLALFSGLLFGLLPAIRASSPDLVGSLKATGGDDKHQGRSPWPEPRRLLVMAQVALALVALTGAAVFTQSLKNAKNLDLGFDTPSLLTLSFAPGEQGFDQEWSDAFYRQVKEKVEDMPGVEAATLTENRLLRGAIEQHPVYLPGRDTLETINDRNIHRVNSVFPGFFKTVGIPILQGSDFERNLNPDGIAQAIINKTMAETLWPDDNPIGQSFYRDDPGGFLMQVVGVVGNAKYREIQEPKQFFIYRSADQSAAKAMSLHVRTKGQPGQYLASIRDLVRSLAPDLVLRDVGPLTTFVDNALWAERMSATLLGFLSLLALCLAVLGVYGVVSYTLALRYREISIRMALGAQRASVFRSVLFDSMKIVALGLALGWVLTWILGSKLAPSLAPQLHGASATDPIMIGGVSLLLASVALLSCFPPMIKALRSDPMRLLRSD